MSHETEGNKVTIEWYIGTDDMARERQLLISSYKVSYTVQAPGRGRRATSDLIGTFELVLSATQAVFEFETPPNYAYEITVSASFTSTYNDVTILSTRGETS